MDQERLTPPSPTVVEVREVARLAHIHASNYDSERSQAIYETCRWILGEQDRPCLAAHSKTTRSQH